MIHFIDFTVNTDTQNYNNSIVTFGNDSYFTLSLFCNLSTPDLLCIPGNDYIISAFISKYLHGKEITTRRFIG